MPTNLTGGLLRSEFTYIDENSGHESATLKDLCREPTITWNTDFLERYVSGQDTWPLTSIRGIIKNGKAAPQKTKCGTFSGAVEASFLNLDKTIPVNIAISGGLDSQSLALCARELGFKVNTFYLRTDISGYCENQPVGEFCAKYDFPLTVFKTDAAEFINLHKIFLRITECPIYNLHPLSKLIFAKNCAERNIKQVFSGDGADQIMAGAVFCDLYFLTKAVFEYFGIRLVTPFATNNLKAWVEANGPVKNKEPLRIWAQESWGLTTSKKAPTRLPELYSHTSTLTESLRLLEIILCVE